MFVKKIGNIEFGKKISIVYHNYLRFVVDELNVVENFNAGWVPYLKNIKSHKGIVSDELAKILMVSKPMITKTIHQLLESELVVVSVNPDDKRSKKLFLTQKGDSLLEEINPVLKEVQSRVLEGLSVEEVDLLDKLLDRVYLNIDKN